MWFDVISSVLLCLPVSGAHLVARALAHFSLIIVFHNFIFVYFSALQQRIAWRLSGIKKLFNDYYDYSHSALFLLSFSSSPSLSLSLFSSLSTPVDASARVQFVSECNSRQLSLNKMIVFSLCCCCVFAICLTAEFYRSPPPLIGYLLLSSSTTACICNHFSINFFSIHRKRKHLQNGISKP